MISVGTLHLSPLQRQTKLPIGHLGSSLRPINLADVQLIRDFKRRPGFALKYVYLPVAVLPTKNTRSSSC